MMEKLLLQPNSNVLDLGCGTGALTKLLSDRVGSGGRVIAVDPDEERLAYAQKNYPAKNIKYVLGDGITFPSGQYNAVFCNATIHWIRDKKELYHHVFSNLQPGGQFAFTTPDGNIPTPAIGKKLFDELVRPDFFEWLSTEVKSYLTAADYKALASAAGFKEDSVVMEEIPLQWKDLDDYIEAMFGWSGGIFDPSQINKEALKKIKEDNGDGPVCLPKPLHILEIILSKPILL